MMLVMTKLDGHTIRRLAVLGMLDPRTIRRAHTGLPIRILAQHRLRAAAAALGCLDAFPGLETKVLGTVADAPKGK